jgi:hypothetical protein
VLHREVVLAITFFEKELKSNLEYQQLQKESVGKGSPSKSDRGNWVNLILCHPLAQWRLIFCQIDHALNVISLLMN